MKKPFFLLVFLIAALYVSAQDIYTYADKYGRFANITFSGGNMLVEQGGIVKAFRPRNKYNWISYDGCSIVFENNMSALILNVEGTNYVFIMQPNNQEDPYYPDNTTPVKRKCGYCNGTGSIDSYVATYGNTTPKWCDGCGKMKPAGHCHGCKTCPSCGGKKYR